MRSTSTSSNRLLLPIAFVASLAGMWTLRWAFSTNDPPPRIQAGSLQQRRTPSSERSNPGMVTKAVQPVGLFSIKSGWVVWPENGDAAAVTEAFQAPLEKLKAAGHNYSGISETTAKARQIFADWWKVDPQGAERFVSEPPVRVFRDLPPGWICRTLSPDGRFFVAGGAGVNGLRMYRTPDFYVVRDFSHPEQSRQWDVTWSQDSRFFLTSSHTGKITCWTPEQSEPL